MSDLWPPDLLKTEFTKTPLAILKEQATMLGKHTKNVIEGTVIKRGTSSENGFAFTYAFLVVAPALGNYRYRILEISYDVTLYPVYIDAEADIHNAIVEQVQTEGSFIVARNEQEFVSALRTIFATKKVKQVISAIALQSGSGPADEEEIPF